MFNNIDFSDMGQWPRDKILSTYETLREELPKQIFGSDWLQVAIKFLILKYRHVFSRKVNKLPATVTPYHFTIDPVKWHCNKNRTGRRLFDATRTTELEKIIQVLLEAGVIKTSSAAYYSHGFVVPKATSGQWRLVVDYKNLNAISEKMQ